MTSPLAVQVTAIDLSDAAITRAREEASKAEPAAPDNLTFKQVTSTLPCSASAKVEHGPLCKHACECLASASCCGACALQELEPALAKQANCSRREQAILTGCCHARRRTCWMQWLCVQPWATSNLTQSLTALSSIASRMPSRRCTHPTSALMCEPCSVAERSPHPNLLCCM